MVRIVQIGSDAVVCSAEISALGEEGGVSNP